MGSASGGDAPGAALARQCGSLPRATPTRISGPPEIELRSLYASGTARTMRGGGQVACSGGRGGLASWGGARAEDRGWCPPRTSRGFRSSRMRWQVCDGLLYNYFEDKEAVTRTCSPALRGAGYGAPRAGSGLGEALPGAPAPVSAGPCRWSKTLTPHAGQGKPAAVNLAHTCPGLRPPRPARRTRRAGRCRFRRRRDWGI